MTHVQLNNQQQTPPLKRPQNLQSILAAIVRLSELESRLRPDDEIVVNLVDRDTIARINHDHLGHEGPTDVISFAYLEAPGFDAMHTHTPAVAGELFVCPDVAADCARGPAAADTRADAPAPTGSLGEELVLYCIHGILHLCGHDDHTEEQRLTMRRREKILLRQIKQEFDVQTLFQERP